MQRREFGTLDAVRGVAALVVVVWHVGLKLGVPIGSGYLAVDLFFMLSGFVIAHSYENRLRAGWPPSRFGIARVIRLWPLYLFASSAALLLGVAVSPINRDLIYSAASAPLMIPRLHSASGIAFPLDDPAWSLFCEVVANVAYAVVGFRLSSLALSSVAALCLVGLMVSAYIYADLHVALNLGALSHHLHVGLLRTGFGFCAGVVLYRAWRADRLPRMRLPPIVPVALAVLTLTVPRMAAAHALPLALLIVAVVFPFLIVSAAQVEPAGRARRLVKLSARISYPLYLIHMVLLQAGVAIAARGVLPPAMVVPVMGLVAVLISGPLDRLYDQPVRAWLSRKFDMSPKTPAAALPL